MQMQKEMYQGLSSSGDKALKYLVFTVSKLDLLADRKLDFLSGLQLVIADNHIHVTALVLYHCIIYADPNVKIT